MIKIIIEGKEAYGLHEGIVKRLAYAIKWYLQMNYMSPFFAKSDRLGCLSNDKINITIECNDIKEDSNDYFVNTGDENYSFDRLEGFKEMLEHFTSKRAFPIKGSK